MYKILIKSSEIVNNFFLIYQCNIIVLRISNDKIKDHTTGTILQKHEKRAHY